MAQRGRRVLLLDLDPQAHLTVNFNADPADGDVTVYEILTGSASAAEARIKVAENLWLIPAHTDLVAAESELVSVVGREVILRDALEPLAGDHDELLIDCPPSLGILTLNALCAADEVLIPLQPHFLALQGLAKLLETISLVEARINGRLRVSGIVLCMFEAGTRLAGEVVDDLRRFLEQSRGADVPWADARVFETVIRRNIKLAEAPGHGQSIFDYAPKSNGALDYLALAEELVGPAGQATAELVADPGRDATVEQERRPVPQRVITADAVRQAIAGGPGRSRPAPAEPPEIAAPIAVPSAAEDESITTVA